MGKTYTLYLRVSTKRQGKSHLGIEAQEAVCREHVEKTGGNVDAIYQDVESGTSRTRKGLWDAIEHCKETGSTLLIAKLDRLARDVEFTFKIMNTGIDIYFCDMPSVNTIILGVFASVAQYERELTSERTKKALRAKKERGETLGRPKGCDLSAATKASAIAKNEAAKTNENNIRFWKQVCEWERMTGIKADKADPDDLVLYLNNTDCKTARGFAFDRNRFRAMYAKCKGLFTTSNI